jgi:hypothetical protein
MIKITKKEWENIHKDYKGKIKHNCSSEHVGRKGCFLGCIQKDGGTKLAIEGIDFEIVD